MQQVGGSIGTALLSSIFATAARSYVQGAGAPPTPALLAKGAVHGYDVAFWVAAGVFAFGAIVVGTLMRTIRVTSPAGEPAVARH
jgi:hypothetical protein